METCDELAREIATLSAHIDAATHRLLACIRSFDETGGWHEQAAPRVSAETPWWPSQADGMLRVFESPHTMQRSVGAVPT